MRDGIILNKVPWTKSVPSPCLPPSVSEQMAKAKERQERSHMEGIGKNSEMRKSLGKALLPAQPLSTGPLPSCLAPPQAHLLLEDLGLGRSPWNGDRVGRKPCSWGVVVSRSGERAPQEAAPNSGPKSYFGFSSFPAVDQFSCYPAGMAFF